MLNAGFSRLGLDSSWIYRGGVVYARIFVIVMILIPQAPLAAANATSVQVRGLRSIGVTLVSPVDPSFKSTVQRLLPNDLVKPALALKPLVTVISNKSQRSIIAYAVIWKLTYADRPPETTIGQFKYPDAVAGLADTGAFPLQQSETRPIASGEERVVARMFEFGPWDGISQFQSQILDYAHTQATESADAVVVDITLDAVIFDDGRLEGPDGSNLEHDFLLYFNAKQSIFRQIVASLANGNNVETAFRPIENVARANDTSASDDIQYQHLAATEILALRNRIGDDRVHTVFEQAIRKEPFVIRHNVDRR